MDKERLKLIIRNMELLLDSLKAEIYSDVSYSTSVDTTELSGFKHYDYDEIFEE